MGSIKEINIKNCTIYIFDDIIKIKDFNPDLLKIHKKSYKNINISYIGYISMKDSDYVKINSVNPLYIIIDEADGHSEERNENKCLNFASTDNNKEVLKKYRKIWDKIKDLFNKINDKSNEYGKDFMKINFN